MFRTRSRRAWHVPAAEVRFETLESRVLLAAPTAPQFLPYYAVGSQPGSQADWVSLTWSPVANATEYRLERQLSGGGWTSIFSGFATSAIDSDRTGEHLARGEDYSYRVRAGNADGLSVVSQGLSLTVTISLPPLTASVTGSITRTDLTVFGVPTVQTRSISLRAYGNPLQQAETTGDTVPILSTQTTWVLSHGLNSDPGIWDGSYGDEDFAASLLARRQSLGFNERAVVVDWRDAAALVQTGTVGTSDNWVQPAALWVSAALTETGFSDTNRLNFIGHSWGSYISAETAERLPGGSVNTIIALDPGEDGLGTKYNPDAVSPVREVDFARNSRFSWAFYATSSGANLGSEVTPLSADEAFVVRGTDHTGIRAVFLELLSEQDFPSEKLGFSDFGPAPIPRTWLPNSFNDAAAFQVTVGQTTPPASGFEAVIDVTQSATATTVDRIIYFDRITTQADLWAAATALAIAEFRQYGTNAADPSQVRVDETVVNYAAGVSAASTVTFFAAADPASQRYAIGSRTVSALASGGRSRAITALSLAGLPNSVLQSQTIYVGAALGSTAGLTATDLEWFELPNNPAFWRPDLVGGVFNITSPGSIITWGNALNAAFRVSNISSVAAAAFQAGVYLSTDAVFDANDRLLVSRAFTGLAGGGSAVAGVQFTLPNAPPPGFAGRSQFHLLLVTDVTAAVAERNEANNFGRGVGIDIAPVRITAFGAGPFVATGSAPGRPQVVNIVDLRTGRARQIVPFESPVGVDVALADVTGDGIADIINTTATGNGPRVNLYDGASLVSLGRGMRPFGLNFTGRIHTTAGDLNGDGKAEIIVAVAAGDGPKVRVFDGATGGFVREFLAFGSGFLGGVSIAAADVTGDGRADLIAGVNSGGAPDVRIFDGQKIYARQSEAASQIRRFFAFQEGFLGGVTVAGGDLTGDGKAEIFVGTASGFTHVKVFDGASGGTLQSFFAYDSPQAFNGVRVGAGDVNGDGKAELLVTPGRTGSIAGPARVWTNLGVGQTRRLMFASAPRPYGGMFAGISTPPALGASVPVSAASEIGTPSAARTSQSVSPSFTRDELFGELADELLLAAV